MFHDQLLQFLGGIAFVTGACVVNLVRWNELTLVSLWPSPLIEEWTTHANVAATRISSNNHVRQQPCPRM